MGCNELLSNIIAISLMACAPEIADTQQVKEVLLIDAHQSEGIKTAAAAVVSVQS